MRPNERRIRQWIAPLALLFTAVLASCSKPEAARPAAPAAGTYTARGEIVRVDAATRDVWIHHEAVPDFRDAKGTTVGMESMTMPFPAGPGFALDDLAAGSRGEFTFRVSWSDEPPLRLERWTPLPAGTVLAFDSADQPAEFPR